MKQLIQISIEEASQICGPTCEQILHFIEEEWIHPFQQDLLDDEDVSRIRLIHELMNDLGANDESIPIILHLIDQIHALRLRVEEFSSSREI